MKKFYNKELIQKSGKHCQKCRFSDDDEFVRDDKTVDTTWAVICNHSFWQKRVGIDGAKDTSKCKWFKPNRVIDGKQPLRVGTRSAH